MAKIKIEINDEIISSIIHFVGLLFAIVAITFLIVYSSLMRDPWKIVSFSIYGITLILLFLFSSLYHGINHSKSAKEKLRYFDYAAISLTIAGTFTPVCLTLLRGFFGWTVFGIIWFFAIMSIILRSGFKAPIWITSPTYIVMGWLAILIAFPIYKLNINAFKLLLLGGLFYTLGFIIFSAQKPTIIENKFTFHEIWHILVLLGAISHFLMMFFYILPLA
jgi:hemolysin III